MKKFCFTCEAELIKGVNTQTTYKGLYQRRDCKLCLNRQLRLLRKKSPEKFAGYDRNKAKKLKVRDYFLFFFRHKRRTTNHAGIEFDIDLEYIKEIFTGICAISGLSIYMNLPKEDIHKATLDRIDPTKGYTKGNVAWVSSKYNRLKNNGTEEDFKMILKYLEVKRND